MSENDTSVRLQNGTAVENIVLAPTVKSNVGGVGRGEWDGIPDRFPVRGPASYLWRSSQRFRRSLHTGE